MINFLILLTVCTIIAISLKRLADKVFSSLPKIVQIILFIISLIGIIMLFAPLAQEMILPCGSDSWLKSVERRVGREMAEKNTKKIINDYRITVKKNNPKYDNMSEKEYIREKNNEHEEQLAFLRKWKPLDVLPDSVKESYIEYLSLTAYPLWLAGVQKRESSFDIGAGNGSYTGLGQHHPDFIKKCGYSMKEYDSSWKVQVFVSNEYIKKYVKREINGPEELYAYWLDSSWNGRNVIYHTKSRIKVGGKLRNPYKSNKGLDKNFNGKIEVNPDFSGIFANLFNKKNFKNI